MSNGTAFMVEKIFSSSGIKPGPFVKQVGA